MAQQRGEKLAWFHLGGWPKSLDECKPMTLDEGMAVEEECSKTKCKSFQNDYDGCVQRLPKYNNPALSCWEWYVWLHDCVDHCAKPKIWASLR
jgi:hypothetical protein